MTSGTEVVAGRSPLVAASQVNLARYRNQVPQSIDTPRAAALVGVLLGDRIQLVLGAPHAVGHPARVDPIADQGPGHGCGRLASASRIHMSQSARLE